MMKHFVKWGIPALLAFSLVGCSGQGEPQTQQPSAPAQQTEASQPTGNDQVAQQTVYPLTITDATGKTITIEKAPQRIVSTSPAETEILFALGLGEQVVGVSDYDDYPAEAKEKPKVGGVVKPNEEAILSQSPDLVIGGISMDKQVAEKMQSLGLPMYITHPSSVEDIMNNILTMGKITNRQAQAEEVVAGMKADIAYVTEAVQNVKAEEMKKVYLEFAPGWTVGKGEFMDELITIAKGVNIAADTQGWNQINEEKILQENPDVILYASGMTDEQTGKKLEQIIQSRSGWNTITAIKEEKLYGMDENMLSRPGPRITKGLIEVAKAIYPDLVK
ncbi:ABC transporter substrate-binding protein [Brevibacillus panacihumi W25]|uniref:ABC transporter substrate-binding protein n=2 Tax=Brevibacillus panacihumi TaxID=497735 RepID=V6M3H6_9BACL|nr:ABC transporter substrate-binding protein [Brevibacillus panacihumi W25]